MAPVSRARFPAQYLLMTFLPFMLVTDLSVAFRFPRQPHPKPVFAQFEDDSITPKSPPSDRRTHDSSPVPEHLIKIRMFIGDLGMMEQEFESLNPAPLSRQDRELPTATSKSPITRFRLSTRTSRRTTVPGVGIHHDDSSWAKGVKLLARLLRFHA
ncbi:hypothetical protein RvY_07042 [Ramazzottius varieornatus]|uniref:Uncharacterized protein n=1 Tax=Ramazzottius varieornatus TaxID=947166 RepID=A0A1D1V9B3_RAMVA|nr:hypothetical protein RvY_07042 [Ramazzottius varieornatus]